MALTFIDLFCGIGTIRMGMEAAGHKCVYSVEWDKHKRKIYSIIFGKEPEGADIREVHAVDIPRSDVWTFGAPCQDFSIAGTRSGLEGDRSSLIREVFRLVWETKEEHRPKYLLYENVKGMLSSNKGFDYLKILSEMESLGYDIEWELLNSKDFGVPQNRERVFTLGRLRGRGTQKIFPVRGNCQPVEINIIGSTKGEQCTKQGHRDLVYDTKGTMGCLLGSDYKQPKQILQIGNCMANGKRDNPNQGRVYDMNGISPTLSKMEGGGRQPMIAKDYRIRKLTPKECWRLQGVSDEITDKVIQAGISDTQMYRGAGDDCTVNVIYEIAKKLT